jgi:hypothetical protein
MVRTTTEQRQATPTADVTAGVRARDLGALVERTRDIVMSPEQLGAQRRSFAFGKARQSSRSGDPQPADTLGLGP